jgi:hypothetical protein
MPIEITPEVLKASVGREHELQLPGESAPRAHGALTAALIRLLEGIDTTRGSIGAFESALLDGFRDMTFRTADEAKNRLFLSMPAHSSAVALLGELERSELRGVIEILERAVAARQGQDDYWPEGRLNLGIAYAAMGDYRTARGWLREAVDILSGRGLAEDSYEMAA